MSLVALSLVAHPVVVVVLERGPAVILLHDSHDVFFCLARDCVLDCILCTSTEYLFVLSLHLYRMLGPAVFLFVVFSILVSPSIDLLFIHLALVLVLEARILEHFVFIVS